MRIFLLLLSAYIAATINYFILTALGVPFIPILLINFMLGVFIAFLIQRTDND